MNEDQREALLSMSASVSDIQRWLLLVAVSGSASLDRQSDIRHAATRIVEKVSELSTK